MIVKKYKIKIKPLTLEDDVNTKLTLRTDKLTTNININVLSRLLINPSEFIINKIYTVPKDGYLAWCLKSSRTSTGHLGADNYWASGDYGLRFYDSGKYALDTHIVELYDSPVLFYVKVYKGERLQWTDSIGRGYNTNPYHVQCTVEGSPALVQKVPSVCKSGTEGVFWFSHWSSHWQLPNRVWSINPLIGPNSLQQVIDIFKKG